MGMGDGDLSRLGAGARRQIALMQLEEARLEALKVQAPAAVPKRSKYGNVPVELFGHKFDSQAEGRHYLHLRKLELLHEISGLTVHPKYRLEAGGFLLCHYIADFSFIDAGGIEHVHDVKGGRATSTPLFRLKKRLMCALLNIEVEVIET